MQGNKENMSKSRIHVYLTNYRNYETEHSWVGYKSHVERQNVYYTAYFSLGHTLNFLDCKAPGVNLR